MDDLKRDARGWGWIVGAVVVFIALGWVYSRYQARAAEQKYYTNFVAAHDLWLKAQNQWVAHWNTSTRAASRKEKEEQLRLAESAVDSLDINHIHSLSRVLSPQIIEWRSACREYTNLRLATLGGSSSAHGSDDSLEQRLNKAGSAVKALLELEELLHNAGLIEPDKSWEKTKAAG